ncbi:uncharacterized protein [Spinacia oleracea]|uniref:Proton pump-interactor 1 n=1 Tax=Spinacia oleracea TaxID=3562 RepID=A0A9R0I2G9_SPIOL|nr:uncharacterized protein LOC110781527 [Spinacia oleracea]
MTVDTAGKIEGEKCGLDVMSSSCEDLPPTSVGDGVCECNGDSKDDYVFVNGSDTASDDHVVVEGNGELIVSEPNADFEGKVEGDVNGGDQLENCEVTKGKLDNVVEVNGGESKLENGIVVEEERDINVDVAELEEEIKAEIGGIVESGDSNDTDSKVDVRVRDLEVVEERDPKSAVDEVKYEESGVEKEDDCNALPSLDDDDKPNILPDIDSGTDMVPNGTTVVEAEPQVPHAGIEEQLHLEQSVEHENHVKEPENHVKEPEKLEDEVRDSEVVEDNVSPHMEEVAESDPVDGIISETKPVEEDVVHQSHPQEDSVVDIQLPNGDVKAPDSEVAELLLDGAITEKQSADCQQQDLQPIDSKELDLVEKEVEVEVEVKKQGDLDAPGMSESQVLNSVGSEAVACEQQRSDESEYKDQVASDLTTESEECQDSQTGTDLSAGAAASEVDGTVLNSSSQCDETKIELSPEVNGNLEASTVDVHSEKSDEPVVDHEQDRVHGEGKELLIAQEEGSLESSVQEVSFQEEVAENTGLVDVIDKEVPSEDLSFGNTINAVEATNPSEPEPSNEEAVDKESKDLDGSHVGDGVSGNEVNVSESSHDSGSCLRSENEELTVPVASEVDLPAPCDSGITEEQGIVDDGSYAGDNCINRSGDGDESSSQPKLENSTDANIANGTELEVEPVNGEVDVAGETNCDSEDTSKPKISFGSFECTSPFSHPDNTNTHTDVLNRSTELITDQSEVVGESSEASVVNPEQVNIDQVSASPLQESGADSSDGQNINPDLVRRPFYYLIRLPRFDDVKLSEQIRLSEKEIEEKTRNRDAVRIEYQKRKAIYWEFKTTFEAARLEERAAHKLIIAKRREIDSAQSLINLARNAITVEDVDSQILSMERKIQHETMALAEEKRLVREIKQLNQQREQLAADSRRQQELHQALDRRVETEEQLKVLKKELDALRDSHAKFEESFRAAKKKHDAENALLNELKDQFISVDNVRQKAYVHFQTLKKQAFEKNKLFYNYKDDAKAAHEYAVSGEKESLEQHCVNQVEKFMELWNKNDEFRKDYVRCNMRSTLRRLRTQDGRALGPDEEPPSLGNFPNDRINTVAKLSSVGTVSTLERDFPVIAKTVEVESSKKVIEQKNNNKTVLSKKGVETISKNSLAEPSGRMEIEEKEEEEPKQTKEEEELARKAEEKRKEEEAARLREQRRIEEKAKAQEALERKRKMAEKAQARAEFKARKEAEEKQKEKEKRAKKKGKKKGSSETAETEPAELPESLSETVRELEVTEKPVTTVKKSHKPALYTKQVKTTKSISSLPAPLRNRGKRRIPQWAWWLVVAILAVALIFPLGNIDIIGFIKVLAAGSSH